MREKMAGMVFCIVAFAISASAQTNTFPTTGDVGIGTTTPGTKLQVIGTAAIGENTNGTALIDAFNGDAFYGNNSATNGIAINPSGDIGIGTTAPQSKLQVSDTGKYYNSVNNEYDSNVEIQASYAGKAVGQGPALGFIAPANTDGTNPWEMARILASPDDTATADASGRMYLQTRYNNGTYWVLANNMVLTSVGNVGVGTMTPSARLEVDGNVKLTSGSGASITFQDGTVQSTAYTGVTCGGDYAESVDVTGDRNSYEPGDVMVIDPDLPGKFLKSTQPYSTNVTGVYSTKPGVVGRRKTTDPKLSTTEIPMAMVGIVPTKVSTENGPIRPGDLLVSASTVGYAMKGTDRSRMLGAALGKAMGRLDSGLGVVEAAITL